MRPVVVIALLMMLLVACKNDAPTECNAELTATATCEEACVHLFALECNTGANEAECTTQCAEAVLGLTMSGRVLACYVAATDCSAVDACSETCGPDGRAVPFYYDGGIDFGESMPDADVEADAGFDDAGSDEATM